MANTYALIAVERLGYSLNRHLRAYLAKPETFTQAHEDQLVQLARDLMRNAKDAGLR